MSQLDLFGGGPVDTPAPAPPAKKGKGPRRSSMPVVHVPCMVEDAEQAFTEGLEDFSVEPVFKRAQAPAAVAAPTGSIHEFDRAVAQRYLTEGRCYDPNRLYAPSFLWNLYLISSYCYYVLDVSLMEDSAYDALCKRLLEQYATLVRAGVWYQHLLDRDLLRAGSGYSIGSYPPAIVSFGIQVSRLLEEESLRKSSREC